MTTTEPLQPAVYPVLLSFFQNEVDDFRDNVRNGNLDAADGFHPTLASALDSLSQAPEDVRRDWLGVYDLNGTHDLDPDEIVDTVLDVMTHFAFLIVALGPEYPLVNILGIY